MDHYRNQGLQVHQYPHRAQSDPIMPPSARSAMHPSCNPTRPAARDDVVLLVGKRRHAYHVTAESLIRGSAYFRNLLQPLAQTADGPLISPSPLVMDCEDSIFESLMLLMRYGTFEALPRMSAGEAYQLKREADFYGISYTEHCDGSATPYHSSSANSSSSDVSCSTSFSSGSPKSAMNMSPPPTPPTPAVAGKSRRVDGGVRVSCTTTWQGLAELPEFPPNLADPARLVLVSCLDAEKAKFYSCSCSGSGGAVQWALNFHHRHAFCTACGATPTEMPAKHFADMFMAAAAHYSAEQRAAGSGLSSKWRVSSDSTCMLRFVSSAGDGSDACGCGRPERAGAVTPATIWAANFVYSHAFCTRCSGAAKGAVLLSVMLALRFGGGNKKASNSARFAPLPANNTHFYGQ